MQFIAENGIENGLLSGLGFAACQSKKPKGQEIARSPNNIKGRGKVESFSKKMINFVAEIENKYDKEERERPET